MVSRRQLRRSRCSRTGSELTAAAAASVSLAQCASLSVRSVVSDTMVWAAASVSLGHEPKSSRVSRGSEHREKTPASVK